MIDIFPVSDVVLPNYAGILRPGHTTQISREIPLIHLGNIQTSLFDRACYLRVFSDTTPFHDLVAVMPTCWNAFNLFRSEKRRSELSKSLQFIESVGEEAAYFLNNLSTSVFGDQQTNYTLKYLGMPRLRLPGVDSERPGWFSLLYRVTDIKITNSNQSDEYSAFDPNFIPHLN